MTEDENTSSGRQANPMRSVSPGPRISIVAVVPAVLLAVVIGVGACFGGQWVERRQWEPKYDELEQKFDALEAKYANLLDDNQLLEASYSDLLTDKLLLDAANQQLSEDYQILETHNARLSEDNALYLSQYVEYLGIVGEVNRRLGNSCEDKKSFITPTDAHVAAQVMAVAGEYSSDVSGRWADYYALYNWVVSNIKYSHDNPMALPASNPEFRLVALGAGLLEDAKRDPARREGRL